MKTNLKLLFISAYLTTITSLSLGQDGLILPMPGQSSTKPTSQNTKKENNNYKTTKEDNKNSSYSNQTKQDSKDMILPMPKLNKKDNNSKSNKKEQDEKITIEVDNTPKDPNSQPLIALPSTPKKSKKNKQPPKTNKEEKITLNIPPENKEPQEQLSIDNDDFFKDNDDFFKDDNEFSENTSDFGDSSTENKVEDILPSTTTEATVTQGTSGESINVYPKDTGSAVFMVMKSWQCDNYDSVSLINQALEVYAKEAGEEYQIKGLENIAKDLKVTVEEEDITFDELLDIIASKSGNDWGCDVANKTIYVYPKGIKTESYVSWD